MAEVINILIINPVITLMPDILPLVARNGAFSVNDESPARCHALCGAGAWKSNAAAAPSADEGVEFLAALAPRSPRHGEDRDTYEHGSATG
jgi:hypothetical protein